MNPVCRDRASIQLDGPTSEAGLAPDGADLLVRQPDGRLEVAADPQVSRSAADY